MLPFFSLFNMSRVSKTGESPVFFFSKEQQTLRMPLWENIQGFVWF